MCCHKNSVSQGSWPIKQRLQIEIDGLLGDLGCERSVADSHVTLVGEDLDNEPAMESEGLHGGFGQFQKVHGIGAEMRRQRYGLASPADYASANVCDLHRAPSHANFCSRLTGEMAGMAN